MESYKDPKVIPVSEEVQQVAVAKYNENKKKTYDKMPLVLRNQETGWPLLQVSFFTSTGDGRYEPALGGAKCHDFPIPHFCLAMLFAHVDGAKSAIDSFRKEKITMNEFGLHNMVKLLYGFEFTHTHYGITIATHSSQLGKETTLSLGIDEAAAKVLSRALHDAFDKSLLPTAKNNIKQFGAFDNPNNPNYAKYSAATLRAAVNPDCSVFYNGNLFIDLGLLIQDKACREFLKQVFKPKEFLSLAVPKQTLTIPKAEEEKPQITTAVETSSPAPVLTSSSVLTSSISLSSDPEMNKIKKSAEQRPRIPKEARSLLTIGDTLRMMVKEKNNLFFKEQNPEADKPTVPELSASQITMINERIKELDTSFLHDIKAIITDKARQAGISALSYIIELDNKKKPDQLQLFIQAMKDKKPYTDTATGKVYHADWLSTSRTATTINKLWDELYNTQKRPAPSPAKK